METDYNNEARKFYQEVNSIRKGFKLRTLPITGKEVNIVSNKEKVLQSWADYDEQHFDLQNGTDNDRGEEWTMCVPTAERHCEPPNDVDTEMAIRKLKNGKSTGHDKIPTELIKEGRKWPKKVIYELISNIRAEESGNVT